MTTRTLHVIETHEQALSIWRDNNVRAARVLHLDFHCDLRGLLVNRKTQRAYDIWDRFPDVDEGNFLKHALLEGILKGIRWVHDDPGGREYDVTSVLYETDLSARLHGVSLALRGRTGVPIQYEELSTGQWTDIEEDEILDVDWDYFACLEIPRESIGDRVAEFLSRDFSHIPKQTIVCYSPGYSHPTRSEFRQFIVELASRFGAEIVESLTPAMTKPTPLLKSILKPVYNPARKIYHSARLAARRRGIF